MSSVFDFSPGVVVFLLAAGALYVRAVLILRRRGWRVPRGQQALWWFGLTLQAVALLGPPDAEADQVLSWHMAQHLLLADIAVPFLLAGLRTPVLVFYLPRPVLVPLARMRTLRRVFRFLRRPLVSIPVYLVVLYTWHFSFAFEGALRNPLVHVLQHVSFVFAGVLIWWCAIEPQRRRLRGELWKIPYIFASRMVSMFLGVGFVVSRHPLYHDYYGNRPRAHGIAPLADTQVAGGLMMSLDIVIIAGALIFFFWRASQDADRAEAAEAAAAERATRPTAATPAT
jgi:cytochrome c oxidase assembly factor CtaG